MYQMGSDNFDIYFDKVKKVLDNIYDFCASIETENRLSIVRGEPNNEINSIVEKIKKLILEKTKKTRLRENPLDFCTKTQ